MPSTSPVRFRSQQEANARLDDDPTPLTEAEIRALFPLFITLNNTGKERLKAELSLLQVAAVHDFDASSSKLGRRMLWHTVAIGVIALCQVLLGLWPIWKH